MASLGQLLTRRERRQAEQIALVRATGSSLACLTIVAPGPDKDGELTRQAFAAGRHAVADALRARGWAERCRRETDEPTGPELLVAVAADATELKAALVVLEDRAPGGRLWDLDVVSGLDAAGLPVILGRRDLGLPPRSCLICESDAAGCARAGRHPLPTVQVAREAIAAQVGMLPARVAADLAVRALIVEANLAPKPGLVDPVSNGAHQDMDLPLLHRSAESLRDWFTASWLAGALAPTTDALRDRLVALGVAAEASMLTVTSGINTHKGALFGIGLLLGALGAQASSDSSGPDLRRAYEHVGALAEPLLDSWLSNIERDASHGSAAYRELGITGARGEAASGFSTVRGVGLPALRARRAETGDEDDALRWALVNLMAACPDTNLYARGGAEALSTVHRWAARIVAQAPLPVELTSALAQADEHFTTRSWSPGGSADLLALTWLIDRLEAGITAPQDASEEETQP